MTKDGHIEYVSGLHDAKILPAVMGSRREPEWATGFTVGDYIKEITESLCRQGKYSTPNCSSTRLLYFKVQRKDDKTTIGKLSDRYTNVYERWLAAGSSYRCLEGLSASSLRGTWYNGM